MEVAARLRHIAGTKCATRGYVEMKKLAKLLNEFLGAMARIVRTLFIIELNIATTKLINVALYSNERCFLLISYL